jgi:hypothetical protein
VYHGPEFRYEFLEEASSLVLVVWLLDEAEVLVLERCPVLCKVSVEQVIPTDCLLGEKERTMGVWKHVWGIVGVFRIEKK